MDPNLFTPRADYLLKVRGLSMRDVGILEGDLLAVHRTQDAQSGQVVVARIADEVTVKRLKRRGHAVQLLPENPDFEPIELDLRQRRAGHRRHRGRRDPQRQESVRPRARGGARPAPKGAPIIAGPEIRPADEFPPHRHGPAAPLPPSISLRQSADPRLRARRPRRQLYSQMPTAIIATLVVSALAAYELREGRYVEIVWFWGGLVAAAHR